MASVKVSSAASSEHAAITTVELKLNADASAEPAAINTAELQIINTASAVNTATASTEHEKLEAKLAAAQKRLIAAQEEVEQLQASSCPKYYCASMLCIFWHSDSPFKPQHLHFVVAP